jgi:hypothetical protein
MSEPDDTPRDNLGYVEVLDKIDNDVQSGNTVEISRWALRRLVDRFDEDVYPKNAHDRAALYHARRTL